MKKYPEHTLSLLFRRGDEILPDYAALATVKPSSESDREWAKNIIKQKNLIHDREDS